jgi:1,4-dihydroxy-2-naphthoate octaprenyltransferase
VRSGRDNLAGVAERDASTDPPPDRRAADAAEPVGAGASAGAGSVPAAGAAPPVGWHVWVAGARPRTLPAAVVPVLVGTACAAGRVDVIAWRALAAGVVALALQVGTNYANDYSDGVRGTDSADRRVGPVRLVGSGLRRPGAVKRAALLAFLVAGVAGLALALAVGPELLVVGAAAIAAGWFYTGGSHPYGYLGLGELFVFVFFGVVATAGSAYVQEEALSGLALGASVPVGLLATALLVVNNLRDIPGDTASGKRTLAVRLGDTRTRWLYVALLVGTFVALPLVAGLGDRPAAVVAVVAVVLARRPVIEVLSGARGAALVPVLVATGQVQLVFGVLFAAGLWLSA